ncbi:MAG TPA: hypothetical protein VKE24_07365, partial [Candidatus Acidoferrales bacterium]|nr:hypothetical protein [Candidatus Acidoferrales bacterium]
MKHLAMGSLAVLILARPGLADEIRLKDGTKIIGTIVEFEDNSFKVETSYGFAFVRKDKIAAIIPTEGKPEPRSERAAETTRPPAPQAVETPPRLPAPSPARQASSPETSTERPATPSAPRTLALAEGPLRPPMVLKTAPEATQTTVPPTIPPAASRYVASAAGRSSPADTLAAQPLAPSPPRILALEEGPLRPPMVLKTAPEATQTSMPPTIPPAASRYVASAAGRS